MNSVAPVDPNNSTAMPRERWREYSSLLLASAILASGLFVQSLTYLNHDVAWVLYSSREMLSGAVFGKDIVAANPPLIWWISLLPNLFSEMTGLPTIGVYRGLVFLLSLASIFALRRLLYPSENKRPPQILLLACVAWLLAFAVHRDFGQREQLAVILTLPYMAAIIVRVEKSPLSRVRGLVIGIAAGIGIALKPYFIFVPLLLEGWLLWQIRDVRMLIRPEAVGAVAAVIAYTAALLAFAPIWLFETAPEIHRVYWAFEQPANWLSLANFLAMPLLLNLLMLLRNCSNLSIALFLGAIGFLLAAIVQGKLYTYHVYPAYALLILAGFAGICRDKVPFMVLTTTLAAAVAVNSGIIAFLQISARTAGGSIGQSIETVSLFVQRQVPVGGSFISISTHPFPGFPTALYAERKWGSRSNSRIFLPAVVRLNDRWAEPDDELRDYAESQANVALVRDLEPRPDLILVDIQPVRHAIGASNFDFVSFYKRNEKIGRLLSDYRKLDSAPEGYAAYVPMSKSAIDGTAAK